MKKMLFVMNPYAGTRKANKYLAEILEIFNRAEYQVTVHMTAGPMDAKRTVARLGAEVDLVVCCGGDGTFNETISGILEQGYTTPIGYIPAGSTNDFAASLHLPTDILKAARLCVTGRTVPCDVGVFGKRFFSYVASFGVFTRASYATPQSAKNALGHLAYVLESIQELSQLKKTHARFALADGTVIEDDFLFGAISNSTSVGGVLSLDPRQVDMHDGKLEILLIRVPRDFSELADCLRKLQRQEYNCAMMTFLSTERVVVETEDALNWTLDGEWEQGSALTEVICVQDAIRIRQEERT